MGQFGKARPQWKEIASGYAVIRPESVASVTEVCSFPEADFWGVSEIQPARCAVGTLIPKADYGWRRN